MINKLVAYLPSNNRLERIWKIAQVDFQSRYYNDRLGLLWALIKPVFEASLYFVAFKYLLGYDKEGFGLFLFGGIVTWMVFAEGASRSIGLLRAKSYLIENVQFNHVDLYHSHVSSVFFAFFFNFSAFVLIALIFGQPLSWLYILLPIIFLTLYLLTMGAAFILSTLQPFVKDITHLWDMTILTGFWVSGIFFEPQVLFDKAPLIGFFNPFLGIIMNIRGIVINDIYSVSMYWLWINFLFSILFCGIGLLIFKKYGGKALEKL